MNREESDRLRELCTLAQSEMNSEKLVELIREINRVFEISEEREKKSSSRAIPDVAPDEGSTPKAGS